jgi:hypothetical protein
MKIMIVGATTGNNRAWELAAFMDGAKAPTAKIAMATPLK